MIGLETLSPEVRETHERIAREREALKERFRKEFGHTPKGEAMPHHFEETKNQIFAEIDKGYEGSHFDPKRVAKTDKALDNIVGAKKKRGRPVGSKNKPKQQLVKPSEIGHIPPDDFIVRRD